MSKYDQDHSVAQRDKPQFWVADGPLILASKSEVRSKLLRQLFIPHVIEAANINERNLEQHFAAQPVEDLPLSLFLARAKALAVSTRFPAAFVLSADQTCMFQGGFIHKSRTIYELKQQLRTMRGDTHVLTSSAAIAYNGEIVSTCTADAELTMLDLTEGFLDFYVETNGSDLLGSVGGYQIENLGGILFSRIRGDHYTIMGLPLLEVLAEFRKLGILRT